MFANRIARYCIKNTTLSNRHIRISHIYNFYLCAHSAILALFNLPIYLLTCTTSRSDIMRGDWQGLLSSNIPDLL
jgi:hypothetical protein